MKEFKIKYTELVFYEAIVKAKDEKEARDLLKNGAFSYLDVIETDSALHEIRSIKQVKEE